MTNEQSTMLSLLMGILSALTTGWWGAFGDRHGRKPILFVALFGMLLMDLVFLASVETSRWPRSRAHVC